MTYFIFTLQALVFRKQTGLSAFAYSFRTVRGRWWKIFGTMILLILIMLAPCLTAILILKRVFSVAITDLMYWIVPLFTFIGMFVEAFFTILFLNIDREGLKEKVDELEHPVDPVDPACQAIALGEG